MTRARRLAIIVIAAAVLVVAGRVLAVLYTEQAWYAALDAGPVWREWLTDTLLIHLLGTSLAFAFAFVNVSAVRRSIISLVLPRRLGNVEFGEAVPSVRMRIAGALLAGAIALGSTTALPAWSTLAMARSGVRFGESEPYHQMDLAFYTSWLPFEQALHSCATVVVAVVSVVVVALYALTPSLRWHDGALHVSGYARRHLAVLAAVALLLLAWRFRLQSYAVLSAGSGPDGAFTATDHRWVLPWYLGLMIGVVAGALVVGWATWVNQVKTAFITLTVVLVLALTVEAGRPMVERRTPPVVRASRSNPYTVTRTLFTRRAYDPATRNRTADSMLRIAARVDSSSPAFTRSQLAARAVQAAEARAIVAPGAMGAIVVGGHPVPAAPSLNSFWSRLAHSWREQDGRMLGPDHPPNPRVVRVRDVYERVRRVAPGFAALETREGLFHLDTLYWVVPLYSASSSYPLSEHRSIGGEDRTYFRAAGKAYVQSYTGRVTIVIDNPPDPIAHALQRRFPSVYLAAQRQPEWVAELTAMPRSSVPADSGESDPLFRSRVRDLYLRMQEALANADLSEFGRAFDSLGVLLRGQR